MIPQDMIERVDVLAEGASTVYGSDAIGGVVNFILRKDYKGVELSLNDGISSHGDGQRKGFDLTLGAAGDKWNIIAGVNYNAQDAVTNAERPYLAFAQQLVNGAVIGVRFERRADRAHPGAGLGRGPLRLPHDRRHRLCHPATGHR